MEPTPEEIRVAMDRMMEVGEFPESVIGLLRTIARSRDNQGGNSILATTYQGGPITRDIRTVHIDGLEIRNVVDIQIGMGHAEIGLVTLQFRPGSIELKTEEM